MFALMLGVACTASAQKTGKKKAQKSVKTEQVSTVSSDQEEKLTLTKEVYPQKEENSNLYHGLTKKLTFDRMIPPHGLEVTYDKTVHILFPASVKYVDLFRGFDSWQGGRCGECYPCKSSREELQERDQYERHHGGWLILHLQCEVCQGTTHAQYRDGGLHP